MSSFDILERIFGLEDGSLEDAPTESDKDKNEVLDCLVCGAEETVEFLPDHVHVNKELKLEIPAEARVCENCGHVFFEGPVFQRILETEEKAKGNHWVRFTIKDGQLSKYSLH